VLPSLNAVTSDQLQLQLHAEQNDSPPYRPTWIRCPPPGLTKEKCSMKPIDLVHTTPIAHGSVRSSQRTRDAKLRILLACRLGFRPSGKARPRSVDGLAPQTERANAGVERVLPT
jgi:hypothetical protein